MPLQVRDERMSLFGGNKEGYFNSTGTKHAYMHSPPSSEVSSDSTESMESLLSFATKESIQRPLPYADNRAFVRPVLTEAQVQDVIAAAGSLGRDASSAHFAHRTKNIGFVLSLEGQWFQINQNFFNQSPEYNEFSGGFKRFYDELPRSFIDCGTTQRLLNGFKQTFSIGDGQLVLVQVQSNRIAAEDEGKCLTGQGIHSDGADRAMLVCLERENVTGARNSVFEDGDGERAVIDRHTLEPGSSLYWRDNEVYHYVEPARLVDPTRNGRRTVLIAHYPAMHYISGARNPNNSLPPSGRHPRCQRGEQ